MNMAPAKLMALTLLALGSRALAEEAPGAPPTPTVDVKPLARSWPKPPGGMGPSGKNGGTDPTSDARHICQLTAHPAGPRSPHATPKSLSVSRSPSLGSMSLLVRVLLPRRCCCCCRRCRTRPHSHCRRVCSLSGLSVRAAHC